jgi:hypothetical protein
MAELLDRKPYVQLTFRKNGFSETLPAHARARRCKHPRAIVVMEPGCEPFYGGKNTQVLACDRSKLREVLRNDEEAERIENPAAEIRRPAHCGG